MQPPAVVEHRDVIDDVRPRLLASLVTAPVDRSGFQGAEEALHDRVVPAVCLATHAAVDAVAPEQLAERPAGVLHAVIEVVDQLPLRRPARPQRHLQRPSPRRSPAAATSMGAPGQRSARASEYLRKSPPPADPFPAREAGIPADIASQAR